MNHQKLFTALGLGLLLLIASVSQTLADSPQPQTDQSLQSARSCATFASAEQKIDTIVQFAHTPLQDSKEIRTCYDTLSADQKVQIFYRVAEKRGLGAKIAEEIKVPPDSSTCVRHSFDTLDSDRNWAMADRVYVLD